MAKLHAIACGCAACRAPRRPNGVAPGVGIDRTWLVGPIFVAGIALGIALWAFGVL